MNAIQLGKEMWLGLDDTFVDVVRDADFTSQAEKAQVWAGFIAAAAGAMGQDLGKVEARAVLVSVTAAFDIAIPESH